MTNAAMVVLRHASKVAAGVVPAVLATRLGWPALGTLVFLAILTAGVTCWVLGSDARTARVSKVLLAWRGGLRLPGELRA
jgi:hypothetical protein